MHTTIGPYELYTRTEYSKLQVRLLDGTPVDKFLSEKIIRDYTLQKENPEKYFKIVTGNTLDSFEQYDDIKFAFIPEGIKQIASGAFILSNVSYISFPESLCFIENSAFRNCESLKEVNFPDTVKELGAALFKNCTYLQSVKLPNGLEELSGAMFSDCTNLKNIVLPDTIRKIYRKAFSNCGSLKKINIPRDIKYIDEFPFADSAIDTICFNHNIDSDIFDGSFKNFIYGTNVRTVEIAGSVDTISGDIFKCLAGKINKLIFKGDFDSFDNFAKKSDDFLSLLVGAKVVLNNSLEGIIEKNSENIEIDICDTYTEER